MRNADSQTHTSIKKENLQQIHENMGKLEENHYYNKLVINLPALERRNEDNFDR